MCVDLEMENGGALPDMTSSLRSHFIHFVYEDIINTFNVVCTSSYSVKYISLKLFLTLITGDSTNVQSTWCKTQQI